ncbi:peptidase M23 [Microbacterium sp. HJ5]
MAACALIAALVTGCPAGASASAPLPASAQAADLSSEGWVWPLTAFRLERAFVAPAHRYAAGHRGIDLAPADAGALRAPAAGVVAFAGAVAGRGILTIDHSDGLVTTLEPIETALSPGDVVAAGDDIGTVALGGHAAAGSVHFGVRLHGEYINPLLLLGGVPRAVLLPCC